MMEHPHHIRRVTPGDRAICDAIEHAVFLPSEAATREQIETRIRLFPEGASRWYQGVGAILAASPAVATVGGGRVRHTR